MRTRMNLIHFFCGLFIITVGMTIACAKPGPMTRLIRPEEISSDIQLNRYFDIFKNYYENLSKSRLGKRSDAAPMMELSAIWETLKMIQDAQRKNKQRRQENIRQNKEQILLHNFPSSDADEYTSYDATRFSSFPDVIDKYYNHVQ